MVDELYKFPPFGITQGLPDNEIINLVDFLLPKEWQKELIIQGFESMTQGLTELIKFCKHLETSGEYFQMQGEGQQPKKFRQSGEYHQSSNPSYSKGSYQA